MSRGESRGRGESTSRGESRSKVGEYEQESMSRGRAGAGGRV